MEGTSEKITADTLVSLFPFYIELDSQLTVVRAGSSLLKAMPHIQVGAPLFASFRVLQPVPLNDFHSFKKTVGSAILLEAVTGAIKLKGQVVPLGDDRLFFAASPWVTASTELLASGLTLTDFAPHDNTIEYMIAMESTNASLADSRELTRVLKDERKTLRDTIAELNASREKYRYVVETVREVVFATDEEDKITFLNPFWEEITGYKVAESIGVDILYYLHEDDRSLSKELLTALKERILPYGRHQIRLTTKSGECRWFEALLRLIIDENDVTRGMSGTLNDITKRKHAEAQLRDSEVRLRSIISTAVGAIVVINSESIIEEFNPAAERMFGYGAYEVVGKSVRCLMPPGVGYRHEGFVKQFLDTGINRVIGIGREEVAVHKNGDQFFIDLSVSEMMIGQEVKFTAFLRDITHRKQIEAALLEKERQERTTRERLAYLHDISIALAREESSDAMCLKAVELGRDWLGFDRLSLWFYDEEHGVMRGTYGTDESGGIRDERNCTYVAEHVQATFAGRQQGHTVPRNVAVHYDNTELRDHDFNILGSGPRCDVMLWDGAKAIGTLFADNYVSGNNFDQRDIDILELFAETIGHLYSRTQIQERLRENMEALELSSKKEAEIGGRIQQSLLGAPPPSDMDGIDVAAITLPSREVDGDCFDFYRHNADTLDILIADVMGKGVPAALLSAAIKAQFQRALRELCTDLGQFNRLPEPFEIVNAVNCAINGELQALGSFVTLCYARIDSLTREVKIVDCGHPPTVLYHAPMGTWDLLSGDNCPLGFLPDDTYHQYNAPLEPGDILLFYSDGMTELRNKEGDFWGEEGVLKALNDADKSNAASILKEMQTEAMAYLDGEPQSDDITCVTVKIGKRERSSLIFCDKKEFRSSVEELEAIREFITVPAAQVMTEEDLAGLILAASEAVTNVIQHAYKDQPEARIQSSVEIFTDRVRVRFQDTGGSFDVSRVSNPVFDGSQSHGFGVFIIDQLMDEVRRTRDEYGHNLIELVKRTGA